MCTDANSLSLARTRPLTEAWGARSSAHLPQPALLLEGLLGEKHTWSLFRAALFVDPRDMGV